MRSDDQLIDLLCLWWRVESQYNPVEGYPVECPSCAGYIASRQYDDANGSMETDLRGRQASHIGNIVNSMPDPFRTALHILARNHATGLKVWTSVRIPADRREEVTQIALAMLGDAI